MDSFALVIFGITSNLAQIKLIPALYDMAEKGLLPDGMTIIGTARKEMSPSEFKEYFKKVLNTENIHHQHAIKEEVFNDLCKRLHFVNGNLDDPKFYEKLKNYLNELSGQGHPCDNRIYYLATYPDLYHHIFENLQKFGLNTQDEGYVRLMIEKPIGNDLNSAKKLNQLLLKYFSEDQLYRLDHYLGKESVQNINILKSTNAGFWKIMNNKKVDEIEVVVSEDMGVGNRITYYNDAGAIRDMIQNHLLQVLSLVLMEKPKNYSSKEIHNEKIKILKKLELSNMDEYLIGQYKSYLNEAKKFNVKNSKSETYAKIILNCKNKRWDGTKLVLISGKKLPKRYGRIIIKFKNPRNRVVINLQPRQDITAKLDGKSIRNMKYCIECGFKPNSPDAYESLFKDVINNDKSLFVTSEEVYLSWKLVDKIEKLRNKIKFVYYSDNKNP